MAQNNAAEKAAEDRRKEHGALLLWTNYVLLPNKIKITSLEDDFSSGVNLVLLLKNIFKDKEIGAYSEKAEKEAQKLDNINIALNFIKSQGVHLVSVSAVDIVNKKTKSITNTLWNILREHTARGIGDDKSSKPAKEKLMTWCNTVSNAVPGCDVKDFWASWIDGRAFCAIVAKLCPGKLDVGKIDDVEDDDQRLELAFKTAEAALNVPCILKPGDFRFPAVPDEEKLENYVSLLVAASLGGFQGKDASKALDDMTAAEVKATEDKKAKDVEVKQQQEAAAKKASEAAAPKPAQQQPPTPTQQQQQPLVMYAVIGAVVLLLVLLFSGSAKKQEL